jgi:hypothetical protein
MVNRISVIITSYGCIKGLKPSPFNDARAVPSDTSLWEETDNFDVRMTVFGFGFVHKADKSAVVILGIPLMGLYVFL